MKLKIEFTANTEPVPFTYLSNLNGYLHRILGEFNEYHDDISIYSTSFLHGSKISNNKKFLKFPYGAQWYISSPDKNFIFDFINNVYKYTSFAFGMELSSVEIIKPELINEGDYYIFNTMSPILLKQRDFNLNRNIYYTYEDDVNKTSDLMKSMILKKASKCGLNINENDFDISFNYKYENKKIKWITVKTVNNKTSVCPIFVKTTKPEIAEFICSVGVGHSTGSGFGFLL